MKLVKIFTTLILLLLLSACGEKTISETTNTAEEPKDLVEEKPKEVQEENSKEPDEVVEEPDQSEEGSNQEEVELSSFFMSDGTVASYLGEGNEYASYKSRTQWHNENTVSIYEDNGGTTLLRTYRISNNSIDLIKEEGEYYEEFNPTDDELKNLPKLSTFLQFPIKQGETFDDWLFAEVDLTIDTPYQRFEHVIMLEKTNESNTIQRKYIVKEYGEIKREFIMTEDDNEFTVTSTLESVN
ncbi:hypothetical protein [Paenisporosarcina sp. TG20]|uniref:hypothetical protein n=1 Tax=Paenisporosarcina sp. TG20 TaxID=1211706 RepID=UPI00031C7700|nr:hypothetical protein [Paenisporosarcina sp. TG20]